MQIRIAPVDGYEIPDRMREAVHLTSPADAFPYASSVSRRTDLDHTKPYLAIDKGARPARPPSATSPNSPADTTASRPTADGRSNSPSPAS